MKAARAHYSAPLLFCGDFINLSDFTQDIVGRNGEQGSLLFIDTKKIAKIWIKYEYTLRFEILIINVSMFTLAKKGGIGIETF